MLLAGSKITKPDDELKKLNLDYLYHSIRSPKQAIISQIRQLRIVRAIDSKQYSLLKKQLPYFVCAHFNPPYRKTENFGYIEYFVVDIDNLSEKELSLAEIRRKIEEDGRVVMSFASPGEDGLKVLFRLQERCMDAGLYSLFYKTFVKQFSITYHIEQVVDTKTSDAARACFISIDPDIYYNPEATAVDLNSFIDINNPAALFEMKHTQDNEDKVALAINSEPKTSIISEDTMQNIKSILHPKLKQLKKPMPYVPEQLNEIIADLKKFIEETGAIVPAITNISYGKKIQIRIGVRQAEINLFYGKKGFTVVKSTRTGTSTEINDLMSDLIESFLLYYSN